MTFLRADKRSHYEMFREMVKRRSSAADQTLVITLKKANKRVSVMRLHTHWQIKNQSMFEANSNRI